MSKRQVFEIIKNLCFVNKSRKSLHLQNDKFAFISEVCTTFIESNMLCCKSNENIIIDEQLFPTKPMCRFSQFMLNRSKKF